MMPRQMWTAMHRYFTKRKDFLVQIKGSDSFLGNQWTWQSVTKNWVCLINSVAVRECQSDCHIKALRTQRTAGISNKKSTIFLPPISSLTLAHTQYWPFRLNWVTLNGGGKLWKKSICVFLATQTDRQDHLSVDSSKEKRKARGG